MTLPIPLDRKPDESGGGWGEGVGGSWTFCGVLVSSGSWASGRLLLRSRRGSRCRGGVGVLERGTVERREVVSVENTEVVGDCGLVVRGGRGVVRVLSWSSSSSSSSLSMSQSSSVSVGAPTECRVGED